MVPMLVVLVVVHEFGHYATARKLGVKVLEFGVGFPPRAYTLYTGKTRVLISPDTRFINLNGASDLQLGSLVKVSSGEDAQGNLVARVIELPPAAKSLVAKLSCKGKSDEVHAPVEPEVVSDSDELLKHEGKIRAVENGSIVLADMLYTMNWAPLGGFVRLAGESNPAVPRSLAGKGVGTRFLVLVAGPLMNAILPIAFFTVLLMLPQAIEIGQVVVDEVNEASPAQSAVIEQHDIILSSVGRPI
jgi:regulator of sigma E protease